MSYDDTETTPNQIKKSVAFETVKGIFSGFGATVISITAIGLLYKGLNTTGQPKFVETNFQRFDRRTEEFMNLMGAAGLAASTAFAPISIFCGFAGGENAKLHNKQVDSFTKQLEHKKLASSQALQNQGRV